MPKCEHCEREFSTEDGLAQHMRDKHGVGGMSKHELKEKKKEEREKSKNAEQKKIKSKKTMRNVAIAIVILAALGAAGYYAATMPAPPKLNVTYGLEGFPATFVHWHADVNVNICGEDRKLPDSPPDGFLGTSRLHTHDYSQNIASFPGTDGNGILHTEGIIPQAPGEHTLIKFMSNIGVRFSNESIMEKNNGDLCGETPGSVKVTLNGVPLENFTDYLPRDRDVINIVFG